MSFFERSIASPSQFIALTSLTVEEFYILLLFFETALQEEQEALSQKKHRKRRIGGGRKSKLQTSSEKLFFILYYLKVYPIQEALAASFEMSQGQANHWIHRLSPVLSRALELQSVLPEREAENLEKKLSNCEHKTFSIDGTERRRQRPTNSEEQKKYYSGKKKAHTYKNNIIIDTYSRTVEFLSETHEGKKHDKKICDEAEPTYPEESILIQDTGFQGYTPKNVTILQPKKSLKVLN